MKKILLFLTICVLISSFAFAPGQEDGMHEPGTGNMSPEMAPVGMGQELNEMGRGPAPNGNETPVIPMAFGDENGTTRLRNGSGFDPENRTLRLRNGSVVPENKTPRMHNGSAVPGERMPGPNQEGNMSMVMAGNYTTEDGKHIQVQKKDRNMVQLKAANATAETSMEFIHEQIQNKTKLKVKLSNGMNAEVKVMPDTASETALERLRLKVCSSENNCSIELKEVGEGNQTRAAYEVQAEKQAKVLGLFKTKMQVQAQIDAENGEVIQTKKPWWAFLASESEE